MRQDQQCPSLLVLSVEDEDRVSCVQALELSEGAMGRAAIGSTSNGAGQEPGNVLLLEPLTTRDCAARAGIPWSEVCWRFRFPSDMLGKNGRALEALAAIFRERFYTR